MKSKIFILLAVIFLLSSFFVELSWFEYPANAQRIGSGYIHQNNGYYYVEIDSVRYSADKLFVVEKRFGKESRAQTQLYDGLLVTAYRQHKNSTVEFLVGNHNQEALENLLTVNYTIPIFWLCSLICAGLSVLVLIIPSSQKNYT